MITIAFFLQLFFFLQRVLYLCAFVHVSMFTEILALSLLIVGFPSLTGVGIDSLSGCRTM